ncbi:High cysteine membrane protein EGF-like [Giardia duodenalis]|uniref:High cysteine membrane protein EGF-like n=1 Tax=Giardia intestinalis (strain ATCC 50803 / WB clone C6) TaxID=184922 RepID=A8BNN0_GIAIC|nr:High cysteine membrane protein EGF-like [Giardia intestinalis]KAE8302496.1 High cysteine membrane protein EGF-like [Giardia intestinalis]|eukprot:XP_001705950.1 High cysteine membrane protein EGF-like [Giardia lamblia ATCC 50803]
MLGLLFITVYSVTPCGTGPACVNGDCAYGDGAHFCQCRRGWAGAACDAPRAGFRKVTTSGQTPADRAVNYACLVNGTECTGSSKCNYYAGAYSCDPCPDGFVSYEGECLSKDCFNTGDLSGQEATKAPCNGRGRCLLKDPGLAGLSADDYACDCYPIYRGGLCQSCDDANAIATESSSSDSLPTCNARACQDSDGVVCSGQGTCILDVGLDRESYHYRCKCNDGYTRVGHKCVRTECVVTIDGSPVVCGGFGNCTDEGNTGTFKCVCDSDAVQVGQFCTYSVCTDESRSKICGGVGACVRNGAGYSCDCRGLATGDLCDTCTSGKSAQVGDKCVPLGCLTSNNQESCKNGGTCVKSDGEYHCRCPDMLIAVSGECTSPACMDEELGKVCSGHGTCKTDNLQNIQCTCDQDYTYIASGRCILSSLVDSPATVCSGHGHIVLDPADSSTMKCNCSSIYTGDKCETCDTATAEEIDGVCTAKKCIISTPQPPTARAADSRVCGPDGQYTTFGDPSNPFITCVPKDSSDGNVSAYNGTFSAKPGCVHVSKIDKTRRFFCGFLENVTENLPVDNLPTCAKLSDEPDLPETCTVCPEKFHLVHFEKHNKTCIHSDCHDGQFGHMWYNYCGGVGDCIQKKDKSGYECDCGTAAKWDPNLKACVTDACKLDKSLAGPWAPEYCAGPSTFTLECTVGRDATWQCNCIGDYVTYNKTCIPKSKNANSTTHRARGLCGGPGAGYIDSTGTCVCSNGFFKIGDMCYSYDCLPVGIPDSIRNPDINVLVCSGKGVCVYNQLTGRYGCECEGDLEAFGGYCTYPTCAGKVLHNGEVKYVECKVYDGSTMRCSKPSTGTPSCSCRYPYKSANGLCVHLRCMPNDVYCGGDALAVCTHGTDNYYTCFCSEGYEKGRLYDECIPSKCVYRKSLDDPAIACNRLGSCNGGPLLKDKQCNCNSDAKLVTLRDVSGELRKTCVLEKCISSGQGVDPPIICGGLGRCEYNGCVCDTGYEPFGNTCVSPKCLINTVTTNNVVAKSICGGDTIGECVKTGTAGTFEDYTCNCKTGLTGYEVVDGFCLPAACIFEVTASDDTKQKTMCGGSHLGSCVLNLTEQVKSYCKCDNWYNIVQINTGMCMNSNCLSDTLPGNPVQKLECSGHGKCKGSKNTGYSCTCDANYETLSASGYRYLCIPSKCLTSKTGLERICSGRGSCLLTKDSEGCSCRSEYSGDKCQDCATGYKEYTDNRCYPTDCPEGDSCSEESSPVAGSCQLVNSRFTCVCVSSSFIVDKTSKKCRKSKCYYTDPYENIEKKCYNMGYCDETGDTETCSCYSGTTLVGTGVCVYAECMPENHKTDPAMICNKRGTCVEGPVAGTGLCRCDSSRYRTDKKTGQCFVKECFGAHESILAEVCDGGGTCNEDNKRCDCTVDGFQSLEGQTSCVHKNCVSSDNKLCSGFGACEKAGDTYRCVCLDFYTLVNKDCIPTRCLKDGKICNGGGQCTGEGSSAICSCNQGWTLHGTLCYPSACISGGTLCGGNGDCPLSTDSTCECKYGYESVLDQLCISSQCVQRGTDGTVTICGGNGRCVSENGIKPTCICDEGFSLTSDFVCGVPVPSNKSSASTTAAIVVVVLLVLVAVAGFLIWWFVIRPRRGGPLRERAPQKGSKSSRSKLKRQATSNASLHADVPLLSQLSGANSSIQL